MGEEVSGNYDAEESWEVGNVRFRSLMKPGESEVYWSDFMESAKADQTAEPSLLVTGYY